MARKMIASQIGPAVSVYNARKVDTGCVACICDDYGTEHVAKFEDLRTCRLDIHVGRNNWRKLTLVFSRCNVDDITVIFEARQNELELTFDSCNIKYIGSNSERMPLTSDVHIWHSRVSLDSSLVARIRTVSVNRSELTLTGVFTIDQYSERLSELHVQDSVSIASYTPDSYTANEAAHLTRMFKGLECDAQGITVYKCFGAYYGFPMRWDVGPGKAITEPVDLNPNKSCSVGINVCPDIQSIVAIVDAWRHLVVWKARIPWVYLSKVVFPVASETGLPKFEKFRTGYLELVEPGRIVCETDDTGHPIPSTMRWEPLTEEEKAFYYRRIEEARKRHVFGSFMSRREGPGITLSELPKPGKDTEKEEE